MNIKHIIVIIIVILLLSLNTGMSIIPNSEKDNIEHATFSGGCSGGGGFGGIYSENTILLKEPYSLLFYITNRLYA